MASTSEGSSAISGVRFVQKSVSTQQAASHWNAELLHVAVLSPVTGSLYSAYQHTHVHKQTPSHLGCNSDLLKIPYRKV